MNRVIFRDVRPSSMLGELKSSSGDVLITSRHNDNDAILLSDVDFTNSRQPFLWNDDALICNFRSHNSETEYKAFRGLNQKSTDVIIGI